MWPATVRLFLASLIAGNAAEAVDHFLCWPVQRSEESAPVAAGEFFFGGSAVGRRGLNSTQQ